MEAEKRRFVGIVLGKCEYTMAIIGKNGKMSIHNGKTHDSGRQAMYKKLEKTDKVALEAGNLAFNIAYEIIEQIGSEVRVLNSAKLPFIRNAPTKTDKIVPLPSEKEMARRKIIANYSREVKGRTKMQQEAKTDEDMQRLQTITGVGTVVAYAYVAHVGDGSRFDSGAQVSNYLGFVPRLDYSGTIQRQGHISKRGNGYLRGLMVQATWSMVRSKHNGTLKERSMYLTVFQGKSKKKTIVSIGRRMAELMYSVLRNKTVYELRQWKCPKNKTAKLVEKVLCA